MAIRPLHNWLRAGQFARFRTLFGAVSARQRPPGLLAGVAASIAKVAAAKQRLLASETQMGASLARLKSVAAEQASAGAVQIKSIADRQAEREDYLPDEPDVRVPWAGCLCPVASLPRPALFFMAPADRRAAPPPYASPYRRGRATHSLRPEK